MKELGDGLRILVWLGRKVEVHNRKHGFRFGFDFFQTLPLESKGIDIHDPDLESEAMTSEKYWPGLL